MSTYSKIRCIRLENFMGYPDQIIDFKSKPILHITGDNGTGKSSVIRALEVAFCGRHSRHKNKLIRKGQTKTTITLTLEDGTHVEYLRQASELARKGKTAALKGTESYTIYRYLNKDGGVVTFEGGTTPDPTGITKEILFTTQNGDTLIPVTGMPPEVEKITGFLFSSLNDQDVPLNVGTRNDPTFLVETAGRDNYKTMMLLGGGATVIEAQQNIHERILKQRREDKDATSKLEFLYGNITEGSVLSDEVPSKLNDLITKLEAQQANYEQVKRLEAALRKIVSIKVPPKPPELPDIESLKMVLRLKKAVETLMHWEAQVETHTQNMVAEKQRMQGIQDTMRQAGLHALDCWNCGATNTLSLTPHA